MYLQDPSIEHDIQNGGFMTHVDFYRLDIRGEVVHERSLLVEQILAIPLLLFLMSRDGADEVTTTFLAAFRVRLITN